MLERLWYFDTCIWNQLSDENIEPDDLLKPLRSQGVSPVISIELISELAASFQSTRSASSHELGRRLFSYLSRYVENGIPCLKMKCQMLQAEAMTVSGDVGQFDLKMSAQDYVKVANTIRELAEGAFAANTRDFLTERMNLRNSTRLEAAEFARERRTSKQALMSQVSYGAFLASINPIDLLKRLRDILRDEFPEWPDGELTEVASALLRNPEYRVAHAMASADMYITWRALRAGSLSRSIMYDCFHLVNASYCDVYITKDYPQAEYAPIVLGSTEVRFCDGAFPISDSLLGIASSQTATF
jgi:hypothetical protein